MGFFRKVKKFIGKMTRLLVAMGAEKWRRKPGFDPRKPSRRR